MNCPPKLGQFNCGDFIIFFENLSDYFFISPIYIPREAAALT